MRAEIAAWEAELRGRAPSSGGATVADLLAAWQKARAHEWQPSVYALEIEQGQVGVATSLAARLGRNNRHRMVGLTHRGETQLV